jgi:hypothetical protein
LGHNLSPDGFLFHQGIFKKRNQVKKINFLIFLIPLIFSIAGCVSPLIVGGAVGALGGYAISKDTIQGDTDTPYERLWEAALTVGKYRGIVRQEDNMRGYIELEAESSRVLIRLIRLTKATTRVRVSSRKYHLPNLNLAEDLFQKIMAEAK